MSQNVEVRDYQIQLEQQTYNAWNQKLNALNVLATGGGKSVIMSGIARNGMQQGFTQCIIAHRNELVSQMSAHIGRQAIPHRIVGSDTTINQIRRQHRALFNGQQFVHPTARTSVVGVDTLIARKNDLEKWAYQHDRWMGDECFPAGTMITTSDGKLPIEQLKIGDEVIAFDEKTNSFTSKKIIHVFKNPKPERMIRLTTSTHHLIETTHGHPFWTMRGWIEAKDLKNDDKLLLFRIQFGSIFVGLESIEVLHSGDIESQHDVRSHVYNIEVDELHTYVANEIVVHNCHHFLRANKWGQAVAMMPNALGAGFTATPTRADGQGLGREFDGVFDVMNIGPSMRQLIRWNYLCDFEIVCPKSDLQVGNDEVSASGDWSNQTLRKAAKISHIVGDVVDNYCKYAYGRRAIVFATDVETANEIAVKFTEWGIKAASLSAKTPLAVREKYITEFKNGQLTVLINVDLFDEGFDVPACDVVIMARPTASLGKYRQMIGRALRFQVGKVALIIDMVSNIVRHHLPDKEIVWTLGRRDKRAKQIRDPDEIPLTTCNSCAKPYEKFMIACPYCGAQKPLPSPRERTLEMVEGDLILLDRAMLEKMRQGTVLENPADIAERVAYVAGPYAGMAASKRQIEKIEAHAHLRETIAQWAAIDRASGHSDSEIHRRFWHVTGMDVLTALDASRPASEMNSLNQTIQSWWRR